MSELTRRDALRLASGAAALGTVAPASAEEPRAPIRAAVGPPVFDLAFRGGGVKGAAFVGALEVLFKQDPKPRVRRMIGASAGAIFAACFAAGYSPEKMLELLKPVEDPDDPTKKQLPFALFTADPLPVENKVKKYPEGLEKIALEAKLVKQLANGQHVDFVTTVLEYVPLERILNPVVRAAAKAKLADLKPDQAQSVTGKTVGLLQSGATSDDRNFRKWMSDVLSDKTVHANLAPEMTLAEFHTKISAPRNQHLSLVATDTTAQELLVLNHLTAPKVPLLEAVRMSMGIPLVWPEVKWKAAWGEYRKTPRKDHLVVDGGVLSNFPLRFLLDNKSYAGENALLGPLPALPDGVEEKDVRTVGLFFNNAIPEDASANEKKQWYEMLPAYQTASRVLDTMMDSWDRDALRNRPEKERNRLVCEIGAKGYSALEFDMDEDRLKKLVQRGRDAMEKFLAQKE